MGFFSKLMGGKERAPNRSSSFTSGAQTMPHTPAPESDSDDDGGSVAPGPSSARVCSPPPDASVFRRIVAPVVAPRRNCTFDTQPRREPRRSSVARMSSTTSVQKVLEARVSALSHGSLEDAESTDDVLLKLYRGVHSRHRGR